MKSIIEEMWYGNVSPNDCRGLTKEEKKLMGYVAEHHDRLEATLTDKQKEFFEKYDDCFSRLMAENEREIFKYAFCLGARITIEVMGFSV